MALRPPKQLYQVNESFGPLPEIADASTAEAYDARHDLPEGAAVAMERHRGLVVIQGAMERLVHAQERDVFPATRVVARALLSEKYLTETRRDPLITRKNVPLRWLADLPPEACTPEALMTRANQLLDEVTGRSAEVVELYQRGSRRARKAEVMMARAAAGAATAYSAVRLGDILSETVEAWTPTQTQYWYSREALADLHGARDHYAEAGYALAPSGFVGPYQPAIVNINQHLPAATSQAFMEAQRDMLAA